MNKEKVNGTRVDGKSRRSRARDTVFVPEPSFTTLSAWTVPTVRAALDAHESGDFSTSALLANAIYRDGAIMSAFQTRSFALSSRAGLPFAVEPSAGVDDRRAKSIAQDVEDLWWECFPEAEIAALQRDSVGLGVAVGRNDGQFIEGEWVPLIRRLRPNGLRWSDHEASYRYVDGDGVDHLVTPGLNGWILLAPHGGDSWMYGALRAIALPWIGRIQGFRDFMRWCEKHGSPALAIEEPFSVTDDVERTGGSEEGEAFYRDLKKMSSDALLRLPQPADANTPGWKAKWLELKAAGHRAFVDMLNELRREITQILLGRDPAVGAAGGDGESLRERVRGEFLSADAEALSTALREQVLKPWIVANYDANRPELAPWPRWDTRPPVDLAVRATTLKTLGEALALLHAQGVETDSILEEFHLTKGKKPEAPAPAPNPTEPAPVAPTEEKPGATVHSIRRFARYAQPFTRKAA